MYLKYNPYIWTAKITILRNCKVSTTGIFGRYLYIPASEINLKFEIGCEIHLAECQQLKSGKLGLEWVEQKTTDDNIDIVFLSVATNKTIFSNACSKWGPLHSGFYWLNNLGHTQVLQWDLLGQWHLLKASRSICMFSGMPAVTDNLYTTLMVIMAFKPHQTIAERTSGSMATENVMQNITSFFSVMPECILHASEASV